MTLCTLLPMLTIGLLKTKNPEILELAESDLYYNRALRFFEQLISNYPGSSLYNNSLFNRAMCYYGKRTMEYSAR